MSDNILEFEKGSTVHLGGFCTKKPEVAIAANQILGMDGPHVAKFAQRNQGNSYLGR